MTAKASPSPWSSYTKIEIPPSKKKKNDTLLIFMCSSFVDIEQGQWAEGNKVMTSIDNFPSFLGVRLRQGSTPCPQRGAVQKNYILSGHFC